MGFSYIFAGMVFLFNPNFNIFDLLPDFVGCILIICGLRRLRDLSPDFEKARSRFLLLAWASASKILCLYFTLIVPDKGFFMVFSFIYSLIDTALLLMAFSSFFDGMMFVGTVYDASDSITNLARVRMTTIIFVLTRGLMTLLPELVYLSVNEEHGYMLASYKGVLNVMAMIVSLAFGIVWLDVIRKYLKSAEKDEKFISSMTVHYDVNIAPDYDRFIKRRMKSAMLLITVACVFVCDFYLDGIDYLPDFAAAVFIASAVLIIKPYIKLYKPLLTASGVYFALSVGEMIFNKYFAGEYYALGVKKWPDGFELFKIELVLKSALTVMFAVILVMLFVMIKRIIREHTGRKVESEFESHRAKDAETLRSLYFKAHLFLAIGMIVTFSKVGTLVGLYYFEEYWMINTALSAAWFIVTSRLNSDTVYEIEEKYM
ncbi:MAG: hypothetical protein IKL81_03990 [Clostridia bacterium]|nr:hypothetical protein [Clostridia bacterium]